VHPAEVVVDEEQRQRRAQVGSEVAEGRPPRPDYHADLATLTALYRHAAKGSFLDLRQSARVRQLCEEHTAAAEAERAARQRREAAKAELLDLIRDAETVWADGFRISAGTVEAARSSTSATRTDSP
jgi:hypothetical protein